MPSKRSHGEGTLRHRSDGRFSTDIIGAHRFGMDAIWLNSQSMPCSLTDIKMIHALRDLLEIV